MLTMLHSFLFLASTLVVIYYYHLALVDYRLCKFKSHASYRQKILALEEPLPQPNAPFRKSVGPKFPPKAPGPRVPQRSSLRAIAHLNNQSKYPGLKSKLSQVTKASRSLEELGLEAVSVPLPDSPPPPLELDVFTESSGSFMDPSQHVDVPVFMARSSGRLPLRHFSTSPLSQEVEAFTSPDSTRDSALGISPMYPKSSQPSLLDLALKSPRVLPKKRPTPLAPIVLPAPKLSSRSPPKQFSEVLNESSWPLPAAASVQTSRSASFSSTRPRNELAVPREIARASSFSSTQRRTELIVPLENPRTAPLSPAQQKEEIVRRKSVIQAALNKEKEELARRRSQKRETVNQEKMEVARTKSLQRETLHQEKKTEIIRLKSLRGESSTKEKSDLVRFKSVSLKRDNSKSSGSASFAENAKRFSTLAPSFRIGKTKPRPNLSLRVSTLAGSTADDAVTKRPSWVFGRPGAADTLDSPPLTSLTFSNWGECNQSKDHIPAPPSSPATFAASIKTNKKRISFQKQKKAAKAKAAAAEKVKAKALKREKAKQDELRKSNCSPEAERYHTRSPYDFSSSSSSSSDDGYDDDDECGDADSDIFAIDTNCLPGSAHQQNPLAHPPYEESKNWSTTTHFGDGRDNRRSLSIYSHSVYSVNTQGFPPSHNTHSHNHPPHLFSTAANGTTTRRHPMSSLNPSHSHTTTTTTTTTTTNNNNNNTPSSSSPGFMSQETMRVTPLFHRVSLHQFSARASLNAGLVGTTAGFVSGEYEEEIEELAREFLGDEDGGVV